MTLDLKTLADDLVLGRALELAEQWQWEAYRLRTARYREYEALMQRLLANPEEKSFLTALVDQAFRSREPRRVVDQFLHLLRKSGVPRFFSWEDRLLLRAFLQLGFIFPRLPYILIVRRLHSVAAQTVLAEEPEKLEPHLRQRRAQGLRVNLNHLGEEVLGDDEACRRLEHYRDSLGNPQIDTISIKISSICAQLHPLGFSHFAEVLEERLAEIYRAALEHSNRQEGSGEARNSREKLVYLDMEAYHDIELTLKVFMKTLERPEFLKLHAGIVLQAYLPDSFSVQRQLNQLGP